MTDTPNDNSPWRCPTCGALMKACQCDEEEWTEEMEEAAMLHRENHDDPLGDIEETVLSDDDSPDDFDDDMPACDYCGGTGIDEEAPDDGTEDYDTCPICGGM